MSDPEAMADPEFHSESGETRFESPASHAAKDDGAPASRPPSLAFLFGLLALAFVLAIALAALIVRPFALRR